MRTSLVLVALVALTTTVGTVSALKRHTTAEGRLMCQINKVLHPMKEITVKLLDKDVVLDDTFGVTRSNLDGTFSVSGTAGDGIGSPDPFIKVQYQYSGTNGKMEVNGFLGTLRSHSTPERSYQSFIDYKDIVISDDHCRAYVLFYDALSDYNKRTGENLPFTTLHIRTHVILELGHPYAERMTINIPEGYPISFTTAKQELAHTVRHYMDGSMLHLISDAVRFRYQGAHSCNTPTNEGLAFDEGWGEFWAGICMESFYGYSPYNYTYEGNVAAALRKLQARCGFNDRDMIDVLRKNKGTIHSYREYELASGCSNFPMNPRTPTPTPTMPPTMVSRSIKPSPYPKWGNRNYGVRGYLQGMFGNFDTKGLFKEMFGKGLTGKPATTTMPPTTATVSRSTRVTSPINAKWGGTGYWYLQSLLQKFDTKGKDLLGKLLEEKQENE